MKVAICTPAYGDVRAQFADSLAQLLIQSPARVPGVELAYFTMTSSDLAASRATIAAAAIDQGAEWLLWIDSDQSFPPDTLARLLAADKPVIGCNYPRRAFPIAPLAQRIEDGKWQPVVTDAARAQAGTIEQVQLMGLGLCLVSAEVMRGLPRPWFRFEGAGEDTYFFSKLSQAGVPVFVDHGLSWEIGHIGVHNFSFR